MSRWYLTPPDVRVATWLWYGTADRLTPTQMGRYLATASPGARLSEFPDEGHMVYISHWDEIVRTIGECESTTRGWRF